MQAVASGIGWWLSIAWNVRGATWSEFGIILDRYDSMLRAAGQDY